MSLERHNDKVPGVSLDIYYYSTVTINFRYNIIYIN